jgi:peroxiredoxin Q/BCP
MGLLDWLGLTTPGEPLELGAPAPSLEAKDEAGNLLRLADFYGKGYALFFFFPKADTPGCTAQACSLRDEFDELTRRQVRILGISADSAEILSRFRAKHQLPFPLLTDEDRHISEAFGVPTMLGMAHRQTFLVREGRIAWRDLRASTRWQARDVLAALDGLGTP